MMFKRVLVLSSRKSSTFGSGTTLWSPSSSSSSLIQHQLLPSPQRRVISSSVAFNNHSNGIQSRREHSHYDCCYSERQQQQQQQQRRMISTHTLVKPKKNNNKFMTKSWQKTNKNIGINSSTTQTSTSRKIKKKKINKNDSAQQAQAQAQIEYSKGGIPKPNTILSYEKTLTILKKHCTIRNNIYSSLEKRQTLKPWIMVLLIHRYDRGIRDIVELSTDSIYYNTNDNSIIDKTFYGNDETIIDIDNNVTAPATATKSNSSSTRSIDLRYALTPSKKEIEDYNNKNKDDGGKQEDDEISIKDILIQQKLVCFATEARRIIIDRDIPFNKITNLTELQSRRLSKQEPGTYLSLFSRCFCITENNPQAIQQQNKSIQKVVQKSNVDGNNDQHTNVATENSNDVIVKDFSNRRYTPPSLKASSLSKKKKELLKIEKEKKMTIDKQKNSKMQKGSARISPEVQKKLRAMNKYNNNK
jgi:hypothetical protein